MISSKWRRIACPRCGGHGLVSDYGLSGMDFEGAAECPDCAGGVLAILPGGHLAAWPGGPWCGMWDAAAYARATPWPADVEEAVGS